MDELQIRHGDMPDFYKFIFYKVDPSISLTIFDVIQNEYPEEINELEYEMESDDDRGGGLGSTGVK